MGQSVFPAAGGSSVPNWTLLQTATPSGVASVTFSGLSGYSKYRINGVVSPSGTLNLALRINADTANHYAAGFYVVSSGIANVTYLSGAGTYALSQGSSTQQHAGSVEIDNALGLCNKNIVSNFANYSATSTSASIMATGVYITTAVVSSLVIIASAGTLSSGTSLELLGAN